MENKYVKNTQNSLLLLLSAYTLVTGFARIDNLTGYTGKIQLPEFVFLLIFPIFVWFFIKNKKFRQITLIPLDYAIFCYWLLFIVVAICAKHPSALKEIAILSYLILVYALFNFFLPKGKRLQSFIIRLFTNLGILNAIIGIVGWLDFRYSHFYWTNGWKPSVYYPYLGQIGRAAAFSPTPGMLASLLGCCFLIKWSEVLHKETVAKKDWLILLLIFTGVFLTFAKTMVILFSVLVLVLGWSKKETFSPFQKTTLKIVALGSFLIWLLGTHILVVPATSKDWNQLTEVFTVATPFAKIGNWHLVETNYSINKRSAVLVGCRFFPLGVGPSEYEAYINVLRAEGLFPSTLPNYDPHCIYTGTFAEIGFIAVLILCWVAFILIKEIKQLLQTPQHPNQVLVIGIVACILLAALDGISADIRNARYYWILFAIFAFLIRKNKNYKQLIEVSNI